MSITGSLEGSCIIVFIVLKCSHKETLREKVRLIHVILIQHSSTFPLAIAFAMSGLCCMNLTGALKSDNFNLDAA